MWSPQGARLPHRADAYAVGDEASDAVSESLGKITYCRWTSIRLVDDSSRARPYRHVDTPAWSEHDAAHGKHIKLKRFPKEHKVTLFGVAVPTHRTDRVVTHNLTQDATRGAQQACALRWKIEQFHREAKQFTGIERHQCLKTRIPRNHIACAMLVWGYAEQVPRWRAPGFVLGRKAETRTSRSHGEDVQRGKPPETGMRNARGLIQRSPRLAWRPSRETRSKPGIASSMDCWTMSCDIN